MPEENRCQFLIPDNWSDRRCSRDAESGSNFCKQHNPRAIAEKEAKKRNKWEAERIEKQSLQNMLPQNTEWYVSREAKGEYRLVSPRLSAQRMREFIARNVK